MKRITALLYLATLLGLNSFCFADPNPAVLLKNVPRGTKISVLKPIYVKKGETHVTLFFTLDSSRGQYCTLAVEPKVTQDGDITVNLGDVTIKDITYSPPSKNEADSFTIYLDGRVLRSLVCSGGVPGDLRMSIYDSLENTTIRYFNYAASGILSIATTVPNFSP